MRTLLAAALIFVSALGLTRAEARSTWVSFQPQVRGLGCLRPRARAMVSQITHRIGAIEVTSTCGGRHARGSMHYRGLAIDFRPKAVSVRTAIASLRSMAIVGGIGTYRGGLIHADARPERTVWHGVARRRFARAHHRFHHPRYAYRRLYHRASF